jgi:hypothetical protein
VATNLFFEITDYQGPVASPRQGFLVFDYYKKIPQGKNLEGNSHKKTMTVLTNFCSVQYF